MATAAARPHLAVVPAPDAGTEARRRSSEPMSPPVVWEAPPDGPPPPKRWTWEQRLAPLRERPGEWARFGPYGPWSVKNIGRYLRREKPAFEVEAHIIQRFEDGTTFEDGFIFARYMPEDPQ